VHSTVHILFASVSDQLFVEALIVSVVERETT
jgi:hypothetical protein